MIDWSKAPGWAMYCGIDESGAAWFFENKPRLVEGMYMPVMGRLCELLDNKQPKVSLHKRT